MANLCGLAGILATSLQLLGYLDTFASALKVGMSSKGVQTLTDIHKLLRELHDIVQASELLASDDNSTVVENG